MKVSVLLVFVLIFGLIASTYASNADSILNHLIKIKEQAENNIKNHALKAALAQCKATLAKNAQLYNSRVKKCAALEKDLAKMEKKLQDIIDEINLLNDQLKKALEDCANNKVNKGKFLRAQIKLVDKLIKRVAAMDENSLGVDNKLKLLGLLNMIRQNLVKALNGLDLCEVARDLNSKLGELENAKVALQNAIAQLKKDLAACKKGVAEALDDLNKQKAECEKLAKQWADVLAKLTKELEDAIELIKLVRQKLKPKGSGSLNNSQSTWEQVKKEVLALVDQLKKELAALVDPTPNCKAQEKALRDRLKKLQDDLAKLEDEFKILSEKLPGLKRDLKDTDKAIAKTRGELDATKKLCAEKDDKVNTEIKTLTEELAGIQIVINRVSGHKDISGSSKTTLLTFLNKLVAGIKKKLQEITDKQKADNAACVKKIADLQKRLDDLLGKKSRLEKEIAAAVARLAALKDAIKSLKEGIRAIENSLKALLSNCAKLIDQYNKDKTSLTGLIAKLEEIVKKATDGAANHGSAPPPKK